MSDLAPFVATTLRDKVVEDLQEENRKLKRRLQISQKVEIVSGTGCDDNDIIVRYAEGQMENGEYGNADNLLQVPLDIQRQPCPLAKPKEARVCLGGFHNAYLGSDEAFRAQFSYDKDATKTSKILTMGGDTVNLWVKFTIHNWPEEHYSQIVADNSTGEMVCALLEFIVRRLPEIFPEATVTFEDITLFNFANQDAIQNLPPSLLEKLSEGMDGKKAFHNLLKAVAERYCTFYGEEEEMLQALSVTRIEIFVAVQSALVTKFDIFEITEENTSTLDEVIHIHWECQFLDQDSQQAFENLVDRAVRERNGN